MARSNNRSMCNLPPRKADLRAAVCLLGTDRCQSVCMLSARNIRLYCTSYLRSTLVGSSTASNRRGSRLARTCPTPRNTHPACTSYLRRKRVWGSTASNLLLWGNRLTRTCPTPRNTRQVCTSYPRSSLVGSSKASNQKGTWLDCTCPTP